MGRGEGRGGDDRWSHTSTPISNVKGNPGKAANKRSPGMPAAIGAHILPRLTARTMITSSRPRAAARAAPRAASRQAAASAARTTPDPTSASEKLRRSRLCAGDTALLSEMRVENRRVSCVVCFTAVPGKTLRLTIRGVARDVTHFKHPGGDAIAHYTDGQDATDAFETFHYRSSTAEARLRSLPQVELPRGDERAARKGGVLAEGEKGQLLNAGGGLVLDREGREINNALGRLREELRAEGLFELHPYPRLHFITCYLIHDIALYALALALVLNGWVACGMILRAFAHVQRGGTMHDLGHNEVFSKSTSADRCFMWFTNLSMGFSAHEWRTKHNRHHTSPNMEGFDGNVEQVRFRPSARLPLEQPHALSPPAGLTSVSLRFCSCRCSGGTRAGQNG